MSDAISGELLVPGEILGDWRSALRAIAHRTREAFLRHPWLIETTGSRPLVTPNALRHIEQSVAVVVGLDVDRETGSSGCSTGCRRYWTPAAGRRARGDLLLANRRSGNEGTEGTRRVDAMSQSYEGRAFIRPLDAGIVLLDTEGEPRVERWVADILERHGYSSYSEAHVTITIDVQPSQRAGDDRASAIGPPPDD